MSAKAAAACLCLAAMLAGAASAAEPWPDYQVIMWQHQTPDGYAALKTLGVTAAMVGGNRDDANGAFIDDQIEPLLQNHLGWYVENIATDFYAPYHKASGDKPVNWRFVEAQKRYRENPSDMAVFTREPSLSDPEWLARIRTRVTKTVRAHTPYKPLFYNLADEAGVADLASFWDFDLSKPSLDGMRAWLKTEYVTLDALNRQWGSHFQSWDDVRPTTTAEAMKRTDENYSAWADFKVWMDVAFAHALRAGTDAVHAADPHALAAIEGAQIPGWGGYDYSRLAHAVDAMELYDLGGNVEIVRSLNPRMIMLTTSFEGGPQETSRIWRELLQGSRGTILWDETNEFAGGGPRARQAAPAFQEIEGGLGRLLIAGERHIDSVAILYSQASIRTQWMLDLKPQGDAWSRRDAVAEGGDNALRSATMGYLNAIEHLGLQPRFLSSDLIEGGDLRRAGVRALILPHAIALSAKEADEIRRFAQAGGVVVADVEPGLFDQHSRRLAKPSLTGAFREIQPDEDLRPVLEKAGIEPAFPVKTRTGARPRDVRTYVFRNGQETIVALQRDFAAGSKAEQVSVTLPRASYIYDVRRRTVLGKTDRVALELDSVEPTILSISDEPQPRR